ncbi:MAG: chloride channel protein [Proteobacteria bacterium]|nr:MAG: chloride channel protein [Pseudomonadota bacterium]
MNFINALADRLLRSRLFTIWQEAGSLSYRLAPYWIGGALTALMAVFYYRIFVWSEEFARHWAGQNRYLSIALIPIGMLLSWLLVHFFSPGASGSGIPQLIASLKAPPGNHAFLSRMLNPLIIPVKLLGSCVCVALGGVSGREGPMLQISGSIFYSIQRVWPSRHRSLIDLRSMILAGGAAGLAAAFNTPLGGIIFAIEELAKVHLSQVRTYIFHAVVLAGLLAQGILGHYLYLDSIHASDAGASGMLRVIPVALVIGAMGGLFAKGLVLVTGWRTKLSFGKKFGMTIFCGLIVAGLFLWLGDTNLGSGRELIRDFLRSPHENATFSVAAGRIFGNYFTYIGGVVGGIFAPSLASGAALGAYAANFLTGVDPQVLVLVGMTAFLTGVTQTPFTSAILVLEMTAGHNAIFTLLLASVCAQGAAYLVDPISFYEHISDRFLKEAGIDAPGH